MNKLSFFEKKILQHLIILVIITVGCTSHDNHEVKSPNVLFILADDLGYHDLSYTGSNFYETPNIDQIAGRSMVFTNGYSTSPVCSPSRASLLTGTYPARHGITDWIGAKTGEEWRERKRFTPLLPAEYKEYLPHKDETLAEVLRENGYKTFFAGKWHLGDQSSYPKDHGFDINVGGWDKGSPVGGYFSPWKNPMLPNRKNGENLSMRLAHETARFVEANKDSTFFAYLSFYAVHGPLQTTQEKWKKYRKKADSLGLADSAFEMERMFPYRTTQDNPVYAGLVAQMDEAVGVVMNELEKQGLLDNTIIVFTSDNGGLVSGGGYATSLLPLRGGKGYQWEGGLRVPYFISVPHMKHKGVKDNTPVSGVDFYPTLLDLAGIEQKPTQTIDGVSLAPLLNGGSLVERPLYWHYPHYSNQGGEPSSIIREGNWKLIYYHEDSRTELYDLNTDISEQNDLATTQTEIANNMQAKLQDWLTDQQVRYPTPDPLFDSIKYMAKLREYEKTVTPRLELERKEMLQDNWKPNKDWWNSLKAND